MMPGETRDIVLRPEFPVRPPQPSSLAISQDQLIVDWASILVITCKPDQSNMLLV
jgi:hypothetical protein